jgi:hypothetical protein
VSTVNPYKGSYIIKTGQTSGFGIVEFIDAPATVYLRNDSNGTVYYSPDFETKGAIMVTADILSHGALMSDTDSLQLDETITTVPLDIQSDSSIIADFDTPNAITINQDGLYRVDALVAAQATEDADVTLSVNNNGIPVNNMTQIISMSTSETVTFALTNFVHLVANDTLTLIMQSNTDTTINFPDGTGAILSVQQIS